MENPIVIAHHLIWTVYGSWLPNDPRGSGSHAIRSDVIAQLGKLHFGRKRVQPAGRIIHEFCANAREVLRYPVLLLNDVARIVVAEAFSEVISGERYTCYACAIMPDHVHILIRKHKHGAEEMIEHLKESSRLRLSERRLRTCDHPTWTAGIGWKVFLDHPDDVRRTIGYIERNPTSIGLPLQKWSFVQTYDGWPLHPGHSPNSPYARRLRNAGLYVE